jgi:hypothetical protein
MEVCGLLDGLSVVVCCVFWWPCLVKWPNEVDGKMMGSC